MNLQYFSDQDFYFSIKKFFKNLNIPVHYMTTQPASAKEIISNTYKPKNPAHQLVDDVYFLGMVDDRAFNNQPSIIESLRLKEKDYDGLLIFGVTLDRKGGKLPTRGQIAEVTRTFNREFHYTPVVIVFKYGRYICFSNCERIPYKQKWREGEKAGKVSLLMDIDTVNTHTGHLKILQNLAIPISGKKAVTTFEGLYNYWQEVFSVSLLSKRFYQELSNWYFWALKHVEFPDDAEKDREVRNATSVIRLITRLMFVWFLKEKKLVPDALFDKDELDEHLNYKDSHDSTYYKAILQNLFFATLNTKMKKDDPESRKFVNRQYGIQEFYRYERFFKNKQKALELFETIPFLNGGLFENLDKNIGKPNEVRIDCFSNRPVHEKRLKVPDFLFFGAEDQIDLSDVYGSKKRKYEMVRGFIHILNSYKFTIAENTPIEEEIALDPELLGKVFENLLASYNPETRTTARKQTGSFYTPREIVNYMVDESLISYLEGQLIDSFQKKSGLIPKTPSSQNIMFGKQKPSQTKITPSDSKIPVGVTKEINDKLRHLLSYTTEDHLFPENEVKVIIAALDNAKILDPACGSGAFPMGILHKMVHILSKLDPQNTQWKQRQIENQTRQIKQDIAYAEKINDDKARQKALDELAERLATINDAFDTNELDFGRKLYLIENCIFGVDIQPIAVQIAKLRFFISLIVDQLIDENKENLGIIPLPNLETKFVAANTLIGVEKKGQIGLNFQNSEITKKEKELAKVRERHFSARTPSTKEKYRQKDENLRNEIAELLKKDGFASDLTKKLAHWNPYDQNTFADFFDMEWMFGVKDGFDIVIGNPPYIQIQKFSGTEIQKDLQEQKYQTFLKTGDIFSLFYEKGCQLLSPSGDLCYISNDFTKTKASESLRAFLQNQISILNYTDFSTVNVFDATNYPIVLLVSKRYNPQNLIQYYRVGNQEWISKSFTTKNNLSLIKQDLLKGKNWLLQHGAKAELSDKFESFAILKEIYGKCYYGVKTGLNEAFITAQKFQENKHIVPIYEGKDIDKWISKPAGKRLIFFKSKWTKQTYGNITENIAWSKINEDYPAIAHHLEKYKERAKSRYDKGQYWWELRNCAYYHLFDVPKIIFPNLQNQNRFCLDIEGHYINAPAVFLPTEDKCLLGVLNSTAVWFFLKNICVARSGGYIEVKPQYFEQIPIPESTGNSKKILEKHVDKIVAEKKSDSFADTTALEAEIDARVAHLYNLAEEEYALVLKETNCPDPFRVAALNVYRDIARGKTK
jgi:hypothetical protein